MASLEGVVIKILWSGYQGCSDKLSKEREHVREEERKEVTPHS